MEANPEEAKYSAEGIESMWRTLISTLTEIVNEDNSSRIEMILNMIRTDITYDDPGLFPSTLLISDIERQKCRTCNFWLIYQLLRIASMDIYDSIAKSCTEVLKEIITACFIKQRWLAQEIWSKFVELLEQMNDHQPDSKSSLNEFIQFLVNDNCISDCHFAEITINSMACCRKIRTYCLRVLRNIISIVFDGEDEASLQIIAGSVRAVLRTLSIGNIDEKMLCMVFFSTYFRYSNQALTSEDSLQTAIDVMNMTATSLCRLKAWHTGGLVTAKKVKVFLLAITDLFSTLSNLHQLSSLDSSWKEKLKNAACNIMHHTKEIHQLDRIMQQEEMDAVLSNYKHQLVELIRRLNPCTNDAGNLLAALDHCPEALLLLENAIYDEAMLKAKNMVKHRYKCSTIERINMNEGCQPIPISEISTIWSILLEKIERQQNLFQYVLDLANKLNFKFNRNMATSHNRSGERLYIFLWRFDSKLPPMDEDNLFKCSGENWSVLLDLCFHMIQLTDFRRIGSETQRSLLNVLFSPIEGTYLKPEGFSREKQVHSKDVKYMEQQREHALERLCAIQMSHLEKDFPEIESYLTEKLLALLEVILSEEDGILKTVVAKQFQQLVLSAKIPLKTLFERVFLPLLSNVKDVRLENIIPALGILYCIRAATSDRFKVYQCTENHRNFQCGHCLEPKQFTGYADGIYLKTVTETLVAAGLSLELDAKFRSILPHLKDTTVEGRLAFVKFLPNALKHTDLLINEEIVPCWVSLFSDRSLEVCQAMSENARAILSTLANRLADNPELYDKYIDLVLKQALAAIEQSFAGIPSYDHQSAIVRMIIEIAVGSARNKALSQIAPQRRDESLKQCVRMMLFLLMQPESEVTYEASRAVAEMCARQDVSPWNILCWYRHDIMKLMMGLAVSNYCFSGISLAHSLTIVSHTFECRDPADFVGKHYKTMMAMLLPWCLRFPKCDDMLSELAAISRKDLVTILSTSFLTIYTYLFISETPEVTNRCIEYIMKLTGNSFFELLHSDIKRTVSEILIFYHFNAEYVINAIRSLLSKDSDTDQVPTARIADYIATRFLGVLANFEATLVNADGEKIVKNEALLSLGDIIRLLGGEHITPFRFKIIALLRTALALPEGPTFTRYCVNVWRIFVCTVEVSVLGPLLSTVFVTLEPLLASYPDDVEYIFRYLVLENNSLLGNYIGDLYFLADAPGMPEDIRKTIKVRITAHSGHASDRFAARLEELLRHCNHENFTVRAFALTHLCRLFEANRRELNEAILGQHQRVSIGTIATMVEMLNRALGEQDTNLQLRAAECFGEMGAFAPSHLPPNYAPSGLGFALTIHSDAFAIFALRELCRAYQRQRDSKFVDSFSLAIQEILSERGVSPAKGKKCDVWETIPERLRPIMEPLLTSSYTTVSIANPTVLHPVFNNVRSSFEWSYQWASQMIESIGQEATRNLLRAFKPSLRCDAGTLSLVLPYILLHSLQLCEDVGQRHRIADELQTVFDAAVSGTQSQDGGLLAPTVNDIVPTGTATAVGSSIVESLMCDQETRDSTGKELALECAKYAFGLFDFLERWKRQRLKADRTAEEKESNGGSAKVVDAFLDHFDPDLLARVNFKCHEYARALQLLEHRSIGEDRGKRLQEKLPFLGEIYSRLGDTDSVEGVMALKATEPTLTEQILYHNTTGRLHEAVACYERLFQVMGAGEPPKLDDLNSMIECYLRLDQPETALLLAESLLARYHDTALCEPLQDIQAEPLYRLGRFEELQDLLEHRQAAPDETRHWGIICGSLIVKYRQTDYEKFCAEIVHARQEVVRGSGFGTGRSGTSRTLDELGTYEKRYEQVLKLHMIREFEKCGHIMHRLRQQRKDKDNKLIDDVRQLVDNLNTRLEVLQPNATTLEPIISLRRILLKEMKRTVDERQGAGSTVKELRQLFDRLIGELWMKSTELASKANMYQQALLYILHAESYRPQDLFIKNAKLLWERRDIAGALKVLERGVNEIVNESDANALKTLPKEDRLVYAEGKRLIAAYNAEASNISTTLNHSYFKEAVAANPESEIALVQLAQYLDKLYGSFPSNEQDSAKGWDLMLEAMVAYGNSMQYGSNYIYQSMPRVLSIWLDSTAKALLKTTSTTSSSSSGQIAMSRKAAQRMNALAHKLCNTLSPYFFFTSFSQLISRVAHPSVETYQVLKSIIVKLLLNYPQQTLWMMLSVYKSSYPNRVRRCVEIFNDRQLAQTASMDKLIKDFNALADRFIELTNKEIPGGGNSSRSATVKVTVSSLVKALPKLLADRNFSKVLIPIERCMQLVLNKSSGTDFKPYPTNDIYIASIEEEVTVLHSLQKPRKINLRGHNGRLYTMMMKPKDDLRKDFRLMEFNAVVKQYLAQDPDAKHRRLHIRTYAVLPLNEECGIIEWISNLNTFRAIVFTYYKQRGLGIAAKELRNYNYARTDPLTKKRDAFLSILVPRHPPVFGEWFRDCFPNPHNWFQARSSYIKTTAVISMVGYILGLGDRHGENILFDSTNGDTVHVDFNCLFNRGETFQIPEVVPFRLTHNMVHAMGPLGVEGLFRRCCEIVLRILQNQAPTFMSVLKPFVYDPMVSWSKVGGVGSVGDVSSRDTNTERTDPQAWLNVQNIEERLKGYVKINGKPSCMPLSIEGQVNHLIKEATDTDNLAQMYIGWSGYT
ncbi:serine/threonine-protein kinase ATR-like [Anopheles ziemanni]|uniref:serine/threonine-protein kinase ATR-like n=1 Tax=Anopheles ziemanni TaxID=345580 RepID=UPI0026585EC9|nr:serine/threonine-protein kinase ATR-like isoform X1 [Anopheles coustani]XP_058173993.1 serine/threonine-protein kinase ATR-like [Anopheles ziemanni]